MPDSDPLASPNGRQAGPRSHRAASPAPVTVRGRRTRATLIEAARIVFADRGLLDATIGDITAEADVSHGTFYTYFDSKRDLFREVVDAVVADFQTEAHALPNPHSDPYAQVERTNRSYLRAYRRNAKLMGMLEQAAIVDPDLRQIRLTARSFWVKRSERRIADWQASGVATAVVDPYYAANALGSMVDRCAFLWMVLGEPYDEDEAVTALTQLWVNSLGLPGPRNVRP